MDPCPDDPPGIRHWDFDSGMVRLVQAGKYGFMDTSLDVVIPPAWDFAYPFEGGLAQVGNECRTVREDPEHSSVACSQWFRIDRQGRVASDSTPPLKEGPGLRP